MKYLYMLCLMFVAAGFTACSDDDDNGSSSPAVISKVYLQDVKSSVPDREVTFARLGQLVRVEGSGFTELKQILVNGYDTYFNNALMTDNNVWFTLNSKTPISDADPEVRNTIQFVKDSGTTTYEFDIRSASPSITSIDNTLPMAGEEVIVNGANLQETTSITLPSGTVITDGIESDEDGEWFSFTMPSGETAGGSITSVGANGTAKSPEYFNDNNCYVINYDGLGTLGSWSATYSSDDLADDPLNTGRGKCIMLIPQSVIDEGGVIAGTNGKPWATAGNDDAADDWSRMFTYIPSSTPVSELAMQFDIYCPQVWNGTGQLMISLQNNLSTYGWGCADTQPSDEYTRQATVWVPWMNEDDGTTSDFTTGDRWQTVTIPLTKFANYSKDGYDGIFQNIVDDKNAGSYRNMMIIMANSDIEFSEKLTLPASTFNLPVYLDNFRIVKNKAITVSDFPDEE